MSDINKATAVSLGTSAQILSLLSYIDKHLSEPKLMVPQFELMIAKEAIVLLRAENAELKTRIAELERERG